MLFNSFEYLIFLPIVFITYWFVFNKNLRIQNLLLLIVSYIFYGWWDYRFLSLIVFSSFIDFFCGIYIDNSNNKSQKKKWLALSMIMNLGFLGIFKYFNFFSKEFSAFAQDLGFQVNTFTLDIILPIGISFYTFQTMSYTIDIYRNQLKPTRDPIVFFAFVSFFPQLVAGPIERATNLLPQFYKKRHFDYTKATDGLRQILWGLFKKIVIADNCAIIVNQVFDAHEHYSSLSLILAAVFFAFQNYGDFSGYSDIAIGTARLFGFDLMQNFAFPYFSRDIAEFWRRWHMSLTTWFRDYVYIPLGGSKGGIWMKVRNTFLIFIISGFWHGANWTFMVWGFLNALYFLPLLLSNRNRKNLNTISEGKYIVSLKELFQISVTFFLTVIAWIFFRAPNIAHAFNYLKQIFIGSRFFQLDINIQPLVFIVLLLAVEWLHRDKAHGLYLNTIKIKQPVRWGIYLGLIVLIFWFGAEKQEFIYFQF